MDSTLHGNTGDREVPKAQADENAPKTKRSRRKRATKLRDDIRAKLGPEVRRAKNSEWPAQRFDVIRIDVVDHWIAAVDADVAEIKRALFGVPRKPVESERRDGYGRRITGPAASRTGEAA